MKKIMVLAIIMIAAMAFSMEISRNRVMGALGLGYAMTTVQDMAGDDVSYTVMGLQIPDVNYEFEAKPNDMFKIYLYGNVGYMMAKASQDGEAEDNFSKELDVVLNPMVKAYLPNNLFVKLGLPFAYISETSSADDAEALADMSLDMNLQFGFDNREIYVHGLTPWDRFEKGIIAYGFYNMGLMYSYDYIDPVSGDVESEDAEDLPSYFGIYGAYAHYADAMMIRPYLKYEMQLNEDAGWKDSWLNIGADFAKDFNEKFNLQANLNFEMWMLEDADLAGYAEDAYNTLNIDALAYYYVMPELAIGGGLGMEMDLTTEDANPWYTLMVGAEYTLNLLK